jgi:hypothetical protein
MRHSNERNRPLQRRRRAAALLSVMCAALSGAVVADPASAAFARPVSISIGTKPVGPAVPRDFLGLSYEVRDLAQVGRFADHGNLIGFLRSLGTDVLRFGGATADTRAAWVATGASAPAWASATVSPGDLDQIARIAAEANWRVLLTVNFGHFDPVAAAGEAAYAAETMGHSLEALEFGNEPDALALYGLRDPPWTFAQYEPQVEQYRAAIASMATGLALAGPDQASGRAGLGWLTDEATLVVPALLTAHYYPLAWCVGYLPTLYDLVSPGMHRAVQRMLARIAGVSRRHGIPLRIDETNNISCGGEPGVSNTFSSALWAVDFLTRAMTLGVAGINFHGHMSNPTGYAPLAGLSHDALDAGQLTAQPEWYAMLLASRLIGDRPLTVSQRPAGLDFASSAFLSHDRRLHLVVVDDEPAGSPPLRVRASVGRGFTTGVALRMTAPALGATSGVTLGGAAVQPWGSWGPAGALPTVPVSNGIASFEMAPDSATLVSLPPQAPRR